MSNETEVTSAEGSSREQTVDAGLQQDGESRAENSSGNVVNTLALAPTSYGRDEVRTVKHERGMTAPMFDSKSNLTPKRFSLEAGTVVKHYEIIRKLGSGGMGSYFLPEIRAWGVLSPSSFCSPMMDRMRNDFFLKRV